MCKIIFVLQFNHVVFACKDEEIAKKTIKEFELLLSQVTKDQDKVLWGVNEDGGKLNMVRCSQVLGFYIADTEESWKR